jgi:hypothetical protein
MRSGVQFSGAARGSNLKCRFHAGTNDVLNIHLQMRVAIQTLRSELNLCGWDNWAVRNPDIFNAGSEGNDGAAG